MEYAFQLAQNIFLDNNSQFVISQDNVDRYSDDVSVSKI